MKTACENCGRSLPTDSVAYVCSYDCTFCQDCAAKMNKICSRCGGELVRRARRPLSALDAEDSPLPTQQGFKPSVVWGLSFGIWSFIAVVYTVTVFQFYRSIDVHERFWNVFGLQCSQVLGYALLTPIVFNLASRYPMRRDKWVSRSLQLLAGGFVFALVHVTVRGSLPFAFWDSRKKIWTSGIWDPELHIFRIRWNIFKGLFLTNGVDDIIAMYLPIVLIAYVLSYYQRLREREVRNSHLQAQLEKSRLQTLKSQLQPHFLFNTLNSISALMLTDVKAADRMIVRLGDLLRISLETAGTQMSTLRQELEFVNCYIEIEKVRFEERLNVKVDVGAETLDAIIPHLLLQPLVDNAIKHGISKCVSGGEVRITARAHENELHLLVEDSGPGFSNSDGSVSSGMGLRITRERLETIYGDKQSLELISLAQGAVARVVIPLQFAGGGDQSGEVVESQKSG